MTSEIIRLFKGFIGEKSDSVNEKALVYGLLIPSTASEEVVNEAIKQYGKDGILWNQTFHKDFKTVADTPEAILIIQQLVHYFTTYGFEALGIYDESTVYIPAEKLEVPSLDVENIKLIAINALTEDEVKTKLMTLITSGIALSNQTVADVEVLSDFIDKDRFDEVSNREVRTYLYDKYNIMPRDPEAFLRYLIYKLTHETLKIQSRDMLNYLSQVSSRESALVYKMLMAYGNFEKLSSIFLRNKNLFLALKHEAKDNKSQAKVNSIINRLRKLARTNHKPLKKAVLDSLTSNATISDEVLTAALDKVTAYREIRLLNTLNYRINGKKDIVYRVRNGKSYVSEICSDNLLILAAMNRYYKVIREHLVARLSKKINGKTLYIPEGVIYKAPTSEKQFVNNIPEGSYFELPDGKNLIVAVHWCNLTGSTKRDIWGESSNRVDLDFHMQDDHGGNYGWCYNYRSGDRGILFSGDVVDAPNPKGAVEAYYIDNKVRDLNANLTLNSYNVSGRDIPFELIVAEGERFENGSCGHDAAKSNHLIDPNKIITKFNMVMKGTDGQRQINLGMIKADQRTKRFYLSNYAVGVQGAVTVRNEYTEGALSYAKAYNEVQVTLNELLANAGAKVITTPTVEVTKPEAYLDEAGNPQIKYVTETVSADLDLSIENIDKTSIIELFTK